VNFVDYARFVMTVRTFPSPFPENVDQVHKILDTVGVSALGSEVVSSEYVKRLVKRVERSPVPISWSALKLQDVKGSQPAMLCLDMKDWVTLAKARYRKPTEPGARDALDCFRDAVSHGRLIIPITSVNIMEVNEIGDWRRRMRLARFMVSLSQNRSMVDHAAVRQAELGSALETLYLRRCGVGTRRSNLLRWGLWPAAGVRAPLDIPVQHRALVAECLYHPLVSARVLGLVSSDEGTRYGRLVDEQARALDEIYRSATIQLSEIERWRLEAHVD
jgi:hypothetical protein